MKKFKILLAFLLTFILLTYLLNNNINKLIKIENEYKKQIGKTYVLDKDTLIIVDYSILDENFTLSDGRKVNYILIEKD